MLTIKAALAGTLVYAAAATAALAASWNPKSQSVLCGGAGRFWQCGIMTQRLYPDTPSGFDRAA